MIHGSERGTPPSKLHRPVEGAESRAKQAWCYAGRGVNGARLHDVGWTHSARVSWAGGEVHEDCSVWVLATVRLGMLGGAIGFGEWVGGDSQCRARKCWATKSNIHKCGASPRNSNREQSYVGRQRHPQRRSPMAQRCSFCTEQWVDRTGARQCDAFSKAQTLQAFRLSWILRCSCQYRRRS